MAIVYLRNKETPQTKEQMLGRIKLLSDEIDANEEENKQMQDEINMLYGKIDSLKETES